ncbi:MAG: flagellar basal body P-ring formation chaperone FlgA [Pseudomonadota bacterium]
MRTFLTLFVAAIMLLLAPAPSLAKPTKVSVPMLRTMLKSGEVVTEGDILMATVDSRRLNYQSVRSASDIVGMAARRMLSPGQQLRLTDFETPAIVRKGSRVTMVLSAGGLQLTATGKALEDGGDGAFITVMNIETRQNVEAKVMAPNLVKVLPMGQLALR